MNKPLIPTLLLLACLPWLTACGDESRTADAGVLAEVNAELQQEMQKVSTQVEQELATENIDISDSGQQPEAEITPQGDLLIGGTAVEITPEQRELLLAYRAHIVDIATTGAALGVQGASLATSAMSKALSGMFSGDTEQMEREIEAEAQKIAERAKEICDLMPAMLETEQRLSASLPEFRPYADMDETDIQECRDGIDSGVSSVQ
jgi:hypothetical protein